MFRSSPQRVRTMPRVLVVAAMLGYAATPRASATTVYAANPTTGQIQVIDTATNTVNTLFVDSTGPRGLVFTDPLNIFYTTLTPGKLADYSLATQTSSNLDTFGGNLFGQYAATDPGGASLVFGVAGMGIERFNPGTHALTGVLNFSDPRGLAYDKAGHLFAVLGPNEVAQIDPVTGATIASIQLPNSGSAGANGLAFDPFTGELFVTDDTNDSSARGLYEIPTSLASATLVNAGLLANGLTADGKGNLFIAEENHLDVYSVSTGKLTTGAADSGIFDVAIAPGGMGNTPEPASALLLGIGLCAVAGFRKRLGRTVKPGKDRD